MRTHFHRRSAARAGRGAVSLLLISALWLVAACSGDSQEPTGEGDEATDETTGDDASGEERVLTLGSGKPPQHLDPARTGGASEQFVALAYDPLILGMPDGSYEPRLATDWRELAGDNTEFEITLRDGVVFSDGTPLTAEVVEANIEYLVEAGGEASTRMSAISSVEVVDDLTVQLTFSEPEPLFEDLFSQKAYGGWMISPAAIAEPDSLATDTFGAGPYVLDTSETVEGDTYTYVPNPDYWDPELIYWDKVVVKVLTDQNARLSALTTGQIDATQAATGDTIANGAAEAGLDAAIQEGIVSGIQLNDREGTMSEPLGDVRVRQALNYAVNREAITEALFGDYGVPTEQPVAPGGVGFNEESFYTYDPERARELLAEAGYADGFTLEVFIESAEPTLFEAIGADLEQVGVTLDLATSEPGVFFEHIADYPATIMGWGAGHPHTVGRDLWLRGATGINPFDSSDPIVEDLDQQALVAEEETQEDLYQQMIRRLVEEAWFLPVAFRPTLMFHRDNVVIEGNPVADTSILLWEPAS